TVKCCDAESVEASRATLRSGAMTPTGHFSALVPSEASPAAAIARYPESTRQENVSARTNAIGATFEPSTRMQIEAPLERANAANFDLANSDAPVRVRGYPNRFRSAVCYKRTPCPR